MCCGFFQTMPMLMIYDEKEMKKMAIKKGEEKLKQLLSVHLPENRNRWVLEYKKQGRPVIGLLDTLVPAEIFHAAGMLPYRIIGTYKASTPLADSWRPPQMCQYTHHVLESLLIGELDFLDGIVHSDWDDDERRIYDICRHLNTPSFNYFIHTPHGVGKLSYNYFSGDLKRLIGRLESRFNVKISGEGLWKAIELYDKMRDLLKQLYEMRKRVVPPVSGAEAIGIVMAAFFMPKEQFVTELESLMGYLDNRKCNLRQSHPRLLVISDRMDLMDYLELVENEGAVVAMDDLDSGSRYFWESTDRNADPVYALAKRHVSSPAEPCKWHFDKQIDRIIEWTEEYKIDGVLLLPHLGDTDRLCSLPFTLDRLHRAGILAMSFTRYYHLANEGQLRTRIGAFLETIRE